MMNSSSKRTLNTNLKILSHNWVGNILGVGGHASDFSISIIYREKEVKKNGQ